MKTAPPDFRVQFYTERSDGTIQWCVCDFSDKERFAADGWSPKVRDGQGCNILFVDKDAAQRFADRLNRGLLCRTCLGVRRIQMGSRFVDCPDCNHK